MSISHVIFDMDGLILDTEPLYTAATVQIAERHGSAVEFDWQLKVRQMGLPKMDLARLIVSEMKLPISAEQYAEEAVQIQEKSFPSATLMPGAERLIRHLISTGVPVAVATSSPRQTFELKTQAHQELFSLFNHVVNGSDDPEVGAGKPAPDIFLVCARRFADPPADPRRCLVFEDSPAGVKAALSAGMNCVMVPDPRMFETPHFIPEGVTKTIRSLEDFSLSEFGLPDYKNC